MITKTYRNTNIDLYDMWHAQESGLNICFNITLEKLKKLDA